jgi:phosphosulfolactate synthase (CoM biosynthesis protein A)
MVFDRGWPIDFIEGYLEAYPDAVDIAKISAWHLHQPEHIVAAKVQLYKRFGIEVQTGGPLFEIARAQAREDEVLPYLKDLGFDAVEVSNESAPTTGSLDDDRRFAEKCLKYGFIIHGEVGKKFPEGDETRRSPHELDVEATVRAFCAYVEMGAQGSYWEGHVLRAVIGDNGERTEGHASILEVVNAVGLEHIICEVPGTYLPYAGKRTLQGTLVYLFGPNVNIGNVLIEELAELEEIRDGLFPTFGAPNGDHPWLHSLILSGNGRARDNWWRKP